MINAWGLLYEELNGTMDETYPIKKGYTSRKEDKMKDELTGIELQDDTYPTLSNTISARMDEDRITVPSIKKPELRKYEEDKGIKDLQDYISTTYGGHYTSKTNNVQTLDLIESVGDAEAFCRSNAIKYLSRYDKKGQAKRDILKALHYSLLLYYFSGHTQNDEITTRGYETF